MLFDLRGRGRRRVVQMIYLALALLMGGGLVLFGVGGATSGGLLDAFKNNTGAGSGNSAFAAKIKKDEKAVKVNPRNVVAWGDLAKLRFQDVSSGGGYDQNTGAFTDSGKANLVRVEDAWNRYLNLKPKKVDGTTALLMVQAFAPGALSKPDEAVAAMEYVIADHKPTPAIYVQYAQLAYAANQIRKGDLASEKAVALAPKDTRAQLKASLAQLKTSAQSAATSGATTGTATDAGAAAPVTGAPQTSTSGVPAGTSVVTSKTKNGKIITTTTKNGKTTTSSKPAPKGK